ncbi:uncharacterized protein LOC111629607 [Centruroides sculpturatus]|uniref:uncharacterized protein LOC111629607 n=1 Tax=Centruroides sculpturatus TaxID=218467 RepID=UPI000C6E760C|nr:uncharacterized protein LOC111629607 [Centruroides sculpturatus]
MPQAGGTPLPPPDRTNLSNLTPTQTSIATENDTTTLPARPTPPQHQDPRPSPGALSAEQPPTAIQPPLDSNDSPPQWVTAWADRFNAVLDEDMLESVLHDFMRLTYNICDIQGPRRNLNNTSGRNPPLQLEASNIQCLYRTNRKWVFDRIIGGKSRFCQGNPETIYRHFKDINKNCPLRDATPVPIDPDPAPATTTNPINIPFMPEEVAVRIAKGHNTALGPDKIRYLHWRRVDPRGIILAALFNSVQRIGYIPQDWQESTTVLIHKKGDQADLRNLRPISLSNTLDKLYTACLADRLLRWCDTNSRISTAQKGFLHYQGCVEHNFLLKSIIQDARRTRNECYIAWLDIANAFGSIPHSIIWESLKWHGLHPDAIATIQLLYDKSTTRIRTHTGLTKPVAML